MSKTTCAIKSLYCKQSMEHDFIPTRGSLAKKSAPKDFQVVHYESYKPKRVRNNEQQVQKPQDEKETRKVELNMKRSKYEVIQFGMSGFDTKRKEEAKVQLAIKLGAKPPKNKYINYKQLLNEKKMERDSKKAQTDFQQLGKNSIGKSTAKGKTFDKKRRKAKSGDILDIYGTVKRTDMIDLKKKRK